MSKDSLNSNENSKENVVEELMKLSELKEKGAISEDEFNKLKEEIMMRGKPDTRISEIPSNLTIREVTELLQKKGLANAAEDLGIFPAQLDAIRKKYNIEISSIRRSSSTRVGDRHAQRAFSNKAEDFGSPHICGIVGSILTFIGVFCPIVSAPVIGSLNYFQNGKGDCTIIILLAVASVVLIFLNQTKKLWFTGSKVCEVFIARLKILAVCA
ncbi:SHOCT domain-containing protein [Deltaproteobacteria bacterium TL4]